MKQKIFTIVILLLIASVAIGFARRAEAPRSPYDHKLFVGSQSLFVQISTTPRDMEQGLSGRSGMADNQGMLFYFDSAQTPTFWMKDMNFALDFVWINRGKITGITENAPAAPKNGLGNFDDSNLPLYTTPSPVDAVLEVNAGWVEKNHVVVGDAVQ